LIKNSKAVEKAKDVHDGHDEGRSDRDQNVKNSMNSIKVSEG